MHDKELLLSIFKIASPSGKEHAMRNFIKKELSSMKIFYTEDAKGNIYNISNKNKVLLSSHMDTVQGKDDCKLTHLIKLRGNLLTGYGVIGGDDKCGIYIILELLKKNPILNFVFSVEEEIGGGGIEYFCKENKKVLSEDINFGLIFDRNGKGDVICNKNNYGTKEFEDKLLEIGKKYNFTSSNGSFSDANKLKEFFSCVNLSVGYFNPHSKKEFVDTNYLLNSLKYAEEIIEKIGDTKFKKLESVYKPTGKTYYNKNGRSWYADEYDEYDEFYGFNNFGRTNYNSTKVIKEKCHICEKLESDCHYLHGSKINICSNCLLTLLGDLEDQDLTMESVLEDIF